MIIFIEVLKQLQYNQYFYNNAAYGCVKKIDPFYSSHIDMKLKVNTGYTGTVNKQLLRFCSIWCDKASPTCTSVAH